MPTLSELVEEHTDLRVEEIEHIDRLLASWQLLSDLSFADVLLWAPRTGGDGFVCVAQMRPYTAQTLYPQDYFGTVLRPEELAVVDRAYHERSYWQSAEPLIIDGEPINVEAIPVPVGNRVVAVMTTHAAPLNNRRRGELEQNYVECGDVLGRMVGEGSFPFAGEALDPELAPRVGDGMIRLTQAGEILYASPNALSAYRRLGVLTNMQGESIFDVGVDATAVSAALSKGRPAQQDVEVGHSAVLQRALPFLEQGRVIGVLLLVRDVTQLRYRERQLQRQEAIIREVHHRVKNNLQTIASLLRLQARRLSTEGKKELEEATRRIAAIALVHETLSKESGQQVEFGEVADRLIKMVSAGLLHPDRKVTIELHGDPGKLHSDMATPLAVVLVELLQNAVEHAFGERDGGRVTVSMGRTEDRLRMTVQDNGKGLPEGFSFSQSGLGLQIVRELVESELGGVFDFVSQGGTQIVVDVGTERAADLMPPVASAE